jgi:hypothetical protein
MDWLEILGYSSALLIGLALGLSGAGGSILTVPIMVYLLGIEPVLSTAYSLFVVGSTASIGAIRNLIKGFAKFKIALAFGLPSMGSIFLTRKFILPAIPDHLISFGNTVVSKHIAILLLFAVLMTFSGIRMIRSKNSAGEQEFEEGSIKYYVLSLQGFLVGFLTGLVGAGGGFLIVPALVILAKLPMKNATGTSLLIIATNALIGFTGDLSHRTIDWSFLLVFSAIAMIGIFLGLRWADKVNGVQLKKGFGYFVLIIAALIISKELSSL